MPKDTKMNSTDQAQIAGLIQDVEFDVMQDYCSTAAAVLLAYHFLCTLDEEVDYFWRRKFTGARALFLLNRYLPLIIALYVSPWWVLPMDPKLLAQRCAATVYSQYILEFSQNGILGAISSLRVYALRNQWATAVRPGSGRHWLWMILPFVLTLLLSLVPVVVDAMLLGGYMWPVVDPVEGFAIISYTAFVLAEAIVVIVTWASTSRWNHAEARMTVLGTKPGSLSSVLQRDGLIYFVVILILNVLQCVVNVLGLLRPSLALSQASAALTFVSPLRCILLTHFYFSMQEAGSPSPVPSTQSDLLFAVALSSNSGSASGAGAGDTLWCASPGTPRSQGSSALTRA
ncbi:hypothetical protein BV20DRAFT_1054221 [Pilatotrama ljubarskyi]|nr:hypothetical protein BV20DRAFT_1054221 [Pilatotrama ljubarskyi]